MHRFSSLAFLVALIVARPATLLPADKAAPNPKTPGADASGSPPSECRWAVGPITIDGKADEPAWTKAQLIDNFALPWLGEAKRPAEAKTRARLLWDGQSLYFHADMDDGDLFNPVSEQDGDLWRHDVFEIFLKPDSKKTGYYEFEISPGGTRFDLFLPKRNDATYRELLKKDIFTWKTAVVRRGTFNKRDDRDRGWSVEGAIPWIDLIACGARPAVDEVWDFALCRIDDDAARNDKTHKTLEFSTNAPLTKPDFHEHESYAKLKFLGPPPEAIRVYGLTERIPVTSSTVVGSPDPPPPFKAVRAFPKLKLNHLIMVKPQPGSNLLVAIIQETKGKPTSLIRFVDDPETAEYEKLLDIEGTATDFTFHPKFAENGQIFIGWSGPHDAKPEDKECIVSRYVFDKSSPRKLDTTSEKRIISWLSNGHNGLAMTYGNDGMFYVTTGDGTSDSDTDLAGQDMTRLLSKLLRLDIDHVRPEDAAAGRAYSVPPDNPFVGRKGIRPETWCYGFRNPWRMALDPRTGHLWVTQNGQDLYEQVYLCRASENYGWSVMEGSQPFYLERKLGPTPLVPPTVEHAHSEARSLTGGIVYYGKQHPSLQGAYIYGDFSTGKIWMVRHDGKRVVESREIADTTFALTAFAEDTSGRLLVCDYRPKEESAIYYLEAVPPQTEPSKFPRKLSDSGLFVKGAGHKVVPGVIPYTVNSPLWSDGAYKERFIALPGEEKITPTGRRSWDFPEATVLIKSFALESTAGDPKTRKWIETRFLTKQEGEWIGYSYQWNEAGTDAELVGAKGLDQEFTIRDAAAPGGSRKQTWHYPSRAECMLCHSRAASYVIGVSTAQLNCEFNYGGVRDNQLRALSHAGILNRTPTTDWRSLVIDMARNAGLSQDQALGYYNEMIASAAGQRRASPPPTADGDPEYLDRLADPADTTASLDARARSYLHANCAHCHVPAGGGNAQFQIQYFHSLYETKIYDERPLHAAFELHDPRIVAPGHPERSTMAYRVAVNGRGRMPPVAVSIVDPLGAELIKQWIASLPPKRATWVEP